MLTSFIIHWDTFFPPHTGTQGRAWTQGRQGMFTLCFSYYLGFWSHKGHMMRLRSGTLCLCQSWNSYSVISIHWNLIQADVETELITECMKNKSANYLLALCHFAFYFPAKHLQPSEKCNKWKRADVKLKPADCWWSCLEQDRKQNLWLARGNFHLDKDSFKVH